MHDLLPFVIAGLVSGAVYGLTAAGLVLTYKTSGIFNFAHGALAALGAYLFYQLRDQWGAPWPLAAVIVVLVAGPFIGLALERLAHWLSGATVAAKVVATVGLLTAVQGLLTARYGAAVRNMETFLPTSTFTLGGINVGYDQLSIFIFALLSCIALGQYLTRSRVGTAMRGVVDDSSLLDLAGTSPDAIRRRAWAVGSSFALLSGVLLAPTIGLDPVLLTLLAVQAFGAAAVGRFSSLSLTFVGGLILGVGAAVSSRYAADVPLLSGIPASLPFIVLFVVLLLTRSGRLVELGTVSRRHQGETRTQSPARRRIGVIGVAVLVAAGPSLVGPKLPVLTTSLIYVLMFASLRLLMRTSGQVSLCHVTFAAVGATSFAHFTTGLGLPWLVALVLAGVATVPVGAFVAIPAIRLSGLYLALATLGFGILVDRFIYPMGAMFGRDAVAIAPRPHIGIFDSTTDRGFYFVCVAIVVIGLAIIYGVHRSRLGRLLRGMSDSPLALTTLGTGVTVTRVVVFCLSAFLAGVSGALLLAYSGTASGTSFGALQSLTLVVVLTIAGRGELSGPLVASVALYLLPAYIVSEAFTDYQPVAFGIGAMAVCVLSNDANGITARIRTAATRSQWRQSATRISMRRGGGRLEPSGEAVA